MGLRSVMTSVALLGLVTGAFLTPAATAAQTGSVDRPAELRSGTCAGPGELVFGLANVVLTAGDPQGESGAVPVEQSGTVVPYTLSDLLATSHAIFVLKSASEQVIVACGEIGGAINPDGTLGVGLRSVGASTVSGVAYFTPIDTFDNLLITILLVSDESATATTVDTEPAVDEAAQEGSLNKELEGTDSP
jgi:hypothetical protein